MNPIIKKIGFKLGLLLSIIQIIIIIYIYFFESFVDKKIGVLVILINLIFGIITMIFAKKQLNNHISLRECFSGYFITILISMILSNIFYVAFFNTIANHNKKEAIKKEFYEFNIKNMIEYDFSKEDIEKNKKLMKEFNPFSISSTFQKAIRFLLLYSVFGIIISFVFRNKTSFQEISN